MIAIYLVLVSTILVAVMKSPGTGAVIQTLSPETG
jgi:hypothetical protein